MDSTLQRQMNAALVTAGRFVLAPSPPRVGALGIILSSSFNGELFSSSENSAVIAESTLWASQQSLSIPLHKCQLKAFPTKVADQWEIEIHNVIIAPGYKLFADAPEEEKAESKLCLKAK